MTYETILFDISDFVATITLNRPERLNAFNPTMADELFTALEHCSQDDQVRVIIVTGAGRVFSAGADLETGGSTFDRSQAQGERTEDEFWSRVRGWDVPKPIIAAFNGSAVGYGLTLPLQWDLRIAAENARFGFVFTRRGLTPEALSTWILPRLLGFSKAADLLLSGRMITAAEALELGLVSRVVPGEQLLATAREVASDIAVNASPVAVSLTKQLLWYMMTETDLKRAGRLEDACFAWTGAQADAYEGVSAFLEKRAPQWVLKPSTDTPDLVRRALAARAAAR